MSSFPNTFLKHFQVLPEGKHDLFVVVQSCDTNNTFVINGAAAEFVGAGDLHDRKYNHMAVSTDFFNVRGVHHDGRFEHCVHTVHIFPTDSMKAIYETKKPIRYAAIIASIFAFAAMVFVAYDWFVTNRQSNTEKKANRSNAIVQELFPGGVAAQLFETNRMTGAAESDNPLGADMGNFGNIASKGNTIAELYPAATVLCK